MSLGSVSPQVPRSIVQHMVPDPRLQVSDGEEGNCLSTMLKTAAVIAVILTVVASFVLGGPIVGIIVVLLCGAGLFGLFNSCCADAHNHPQGQSWYSRHLRPMFFMHNGHSHAMPHPHGHGTPAPSGPAGHVHVGTRETTPPPAHFYPGHSPHTPSAHVRVSTGQTTPPSRHGHGSYVPPSHVGVGTGQTTPPLDIPITRRGDGRGNNVPVGRRR